MSILDYNERGYSFMVHKIQMVFHSPAKLGDLLVYTNLDRKHNPIHCGRQTDHNQER